MTNRNFSALLVLIFYVSSYLSAQSKTNYQMIDSLIGLSAIALGENLNVGDAYQFTFESAKEYKILKSKILETLVNKGRNCVEDEIRDNKINYILEEADVNYSELFRDGIFGDFLVSRISNIRGKYFIDSETNKNKEFKNFNYVITDTLLYTDLNKVENIAYPFTTSEIPEEPLFSSALEPAIAIGTAAIAVYLFFNIRSK